MWVPIAAAVGVVAAAWCVLRRPGGWGGIIGVVYLALMLPSVIAWLVVLGTYGEIALSRPARARQTYEARSSWFFRERLEITGRPLTCPAIYVINHLSVELFDQVAVPALGIGRYKLLAGCDMGFAVDTVYDKLGCLRVRRGGGNTERLLREADEALQEGYSVVVFGEGRYRHGPAAVGFDRIHGLQTGAFRMAFRARCPCVPVVLADPSVPRWLNYGLMPPLAAASWLWGTGTRRLRASFLQPLAPKQYDSPETMRDAALVSMNLSLLLPPAID